MEDRSNFNKFMNDVRKIHRTPKSKTNQRMYRGRNIPSSIEKLYNDDTSEFDAVPENREHFLHVLMPLVISIAGNAHRKYTSRIEYQDVVQAGMIGAIDAIDRYIEDAKTIVHKAKLSTVAYQYIMKYVNEYCWDNNTLLSAGRTKWALASTSYVNSGDECVGEENNTTLFDMAPGQHLRQVQTDNEEQRQIDVLSAQLLSCVTAEERNMLFMTYGIGVNTKMTMSEIGKVYGKSTCYVHRRVHSAIDKLKNNANQHTHLKVLLNISNNKTLEASRHWSLISS